jgi:hypothetical protein
MPDANELETAHIENLEDSQADTEADVRLIPILKELFPASGSVADASLIESAEGAFDISTPDDPTGEKLAGWLEKLSTQVDAELTKSRTVD